MVFGFGRGKYRKAVESLNDLLGMDNYAQPEYVSIGISLMQKSSLTGFTPEKMQYTTDRIEHILERSDVEPDLDLPEALAKSIFRKYATAPEAIIFLDDICDNIEDINPWDVAGYVGKRLQEFRYASEPRRTKSRPPM